MERPKSARGRKPKKTEEPKQDEEPKQVKEPNRCDELEKRINEVNQAMAAQRQVLLNEINKKQTPVAAVSGGKLLVKISSPNGKLPTKGSDGAAGYDLYASEDVAIVAGGWKAVSTGIHVCLPTGVYGRVAPRSGLAVRNGITIGAGVVDPDYRGELKVVMHNLGSTKFYAKTGDRIAQLVLERYMDASTVQEVDELPDTARGSGGFGSTGK